MGRHDDDFRAHVVELLAPLGAVRTRSMFGGVGIYQGDLFFALIADGTLYLKVDRENEARFVAEGLGPFVYDSARGATSLGYRRAPDAGLDDGELLREWARGSIDAALRARVAKNKPRATTARAGSKAKPERSSATGPAQRGGAKTAATKRPARATTAKPRRAR